MASIQTEEEEEEAYNDIDAEAQAMRYNMSKISLGGAEFDIDELCRNLVEASAETKIGVQEIVSMENRVIVRQKEEATENDSSLMKMYTDLTPEAMENDNALINAVIRVLWPFLRFFNFVERFDPTWDEATRRDKAQDLMICLCTICIHLEYLPNA